VKNLPQSIICKKRDGFELSGDELRDFASGVADGSVSEAQIAAFSMAVYFQDVSPRERVDWTLAVRDSGKVLSWADHGIGLDRGAPVIDKHSTGGVGDSVSLMLGPMLAACGAHIPMIAGRGLAHTGGTIDKLESIPGYTTGLPPADFQRVVREVGIAIVRQTDTLAPADRRMYAVRDVTATVENRGLITASIVAKKLVAGLDALVLDVKAGNGAVMQDRDDALALARMMVDVGNGAGMPTIARITDMSEPLAFTAGNALEVQESIEYLTGGPQHPRLRTVIEALGTDLLLQVGLFKTRKAALAALRSSISSGAAAERFERMVHAMGGPSDLLNRPLAHLAPAPVVMPVYADRVAVVSGMDVRGLGWSVVTLGGGRTSPDAPINPAVGLSALAQVGAEVGPQAGADAGPSSTVQPLAFVHASNQQSAEQAAAAVRAAYRFADPSTQTPSAPVLIDVVH
jgi:thymidine phosphorylase